MQQHPEIGAATEMCRIIRTEVSQTGGLIAGDPASPADGPPVPPIHGGNKTAMAFVR